MTASSTGSVPDSSAAQFASMGALGSLNVPVLIQVAARPHFHVSLGNLAAAGHIESIQGGDGQAAPAWLHLDTQALSLYGTVPANERGELPLLLNVRDTGQKPRQVKVLLNLNGGT